MREEREAGWGFVFFVCSFSRCCVCLTVSSIPIDFICPCNDEKRKLSFAVNRRAPCRVSGEFRKQISRSDCSSLSLLGKVRRVWGAARVLSCSPRAGETEETPRRSISEMSADSGRGASRDTVAASWGLGDLGFVVYLIRATLPACRGHG